MDFENMTREELIAKLSELEKQRAFTYEDQMKLAILDKSPFTIWASDRDCKITLWEGQCEALYGYSREYVIGKDYVSLFVASDEQAAARRDQLSVIDDAAIFHNIANDVAKNGNTLQLITNCFRIKDPLTGQSWSAEMGLIIDYLEKEKEKLELIIAENRKVKSYINLFIESAQQRKEQFQGRKQAIRAAIAESQRKATALGKRSTFRKEIAPIIDSLDSLQRTLYQLIDDCYQKLQECVVSETCEKIRLKFNEAYDEMLSGFENIVLDFEELNLNFIGDNTVIQIRDTILKEISTQNSHLSNLAFDMLNKAIEDIAAYRKIGDVKPTSSELTSLTQRRDKIQELKNNISGLASKFMIEVSKANGDAQLQHIRSEMEKHYTTLEQQLITIKTEMEGCI